MSVEMNTKWDSIYGALADPHRRSALYLLRDERCTLSLDEVVEHVIDDDDDLSEYDDEARLRTKMYHVHLPKLRDANLAEWDGDTGIRPHSLLYQLPPELLSPKLLAPTGRLTGADD